MAIDASIALGAQPVQIASPYDVANKAMTLKSLALKGQLEDQAVAEDQATRNAFRNAAVTNPDGSIGLDRKAALAGVMQVNPMKALDYQKMFQGQDLDALAKNTDIAKQLSWSISDEPSYQLARANAIKLGLPNADKMPTSYVPSFVQNWQQHTLSGEEQLKATMDQKKLDQQAYDRGENRNMRLQLAGQAADTKNSDRVDKLTTAMKNDFDADKGRAGNFGLLSGKVQSAERLQTLIDAYKNGDLPKPQMEELALGMSNMLANSSGTSRGQVEALVPHTLFGSTQDAASWLLNEPRGSGQQKFVEKMADTINREKQVATDQLNSIRANRLPAHGTLQKLAPDRYNSLLQSYGLDPSNIKNGRYVAPAPQSPAGQSPASDASSQYAPDVLSYAQSHGITPDQAQAIKVQRGGQ